MIDFLATIKDLIRRIENLEKKDPLITWNNYADASTITFDLLNGTRHSVVLENTGNTLAVANPVDGAVFYVKLVQGTGGNKIVNWWSNINWAGGTPTLKTSEGEYNEFLFTYEATDNTYSVIDFSAVGGGGGGGDVVGPTSSTDNAISRFDGTTGKTIQNSGVTLSDNQDMVGLKTLSFNTVYTKSGSEPTGTYYWNTDRETFDVVLEDGVKLQMGQELHFFAINQSGVTINDGDAVMFDGSLGASGIIKCKKAVANGTYPSQYMMGVATQQILNGDAGKITFFGEISGFDTSVFTAGAVLYLDPANNGKFTETEPTAPNLRYPMAVALNSKSNGTIFVRAIFTMKLSELDDVKISSIADGHLIVWNNTNSRFENKSASAVAGSMNHDDLGNIKGGVAGEYNHITDAQVSSLHSPVTVSDGTTIDFTLTGQDITAEVKDNSITEAKQSLSDVTTNDVSISKHGYTPKAPNDTTKFLRGDGSWAVPTSTGGSPLTTKGDLYTFDTTNQRLGVGSDGQFLKSDSTQPTGLKWDTPASSTSVIREVPSGTINGSNTAFTLSNTPQSGSEEVYLNGVLQNVGAGNDYTITDKTISFITAPKTGDVLLVSYSIGAGSFTMGSSSFIVNETPIGSINGTNTVFDTAFNYISGSIQVFRDGQLMKGGGEDYTENDSNTFTFTTAPVVGTVLLVTYQTALSSVGNADTLDGQHGSYYLNRNNFLVNQVFS